MKQKDIKTALLGHVIVRQDVEPDITGAVEWAENNIKGDIKDLPYLSIVMAGVSLPPFLLENTPKDKFASQDDSSYATSQISYIAMESLALPEDMRTDQKGGCTDHLVEVYNWKLAFHPQVQNLIWFYHNRAINHFSNLIDDGGWEKKLQSIKEGDKAFVSTFRIATPRSGFEGLKLVARDAECLQQTLDDLFGKAAELVGVSQNHLDVVQSVASRAYLEALQASDPYGDKDQTDLEKAVLLKDRPSCLVFGRDHFERWRGYTDSQFLWIHGDPGKGKTMLLCGIIDELKTVAPKDNVSFFRPATDARINNATTVLRGLIYMLVTQQPALISHLHEGCNEFGERRFEGPNSWVTLSKVLTSILEDPSLRRTYLVIDALDEYTEDLHQLLALVAHNSSAHSSAKWIMSSRNWASIEKDLDTAMQEAGLPLEHKENSVSAAITTYVQFMTGRLAKQNKYSSDTQDAVEHCLFANAYGIFLSVTLVGRELATSPGWKTERMSALFPPGFDALCNQTLSQIHNPEDTALCRNSIFAVVPVVYRSIVLDEPTALVDTLDGTSGNCEALVGLCGSFLTLRKQTTSFAHQPCEDFSAEQARDGVFPSEIEEVRCRVCSPLLRAMRETPQRDGICNLFRDAFWVEAPSSQNSISEGITSILCL